MKCSNEFPSAPSRPATVVSQIIERMAYRSKSTVHRNRGGYSLLFTNIAYVNGIIDDVTGVGVVSHGIDSKLDDASTP